MGTAQLVTPSQVRESQLHGQCFLREMTLDQTFQRYILKYRGNKGSDQLAFFPSKQLFVFTVSSDFFIKDFSFSCPANGKNDIK